MIYGVTAVLCCTKYIFYSHGFAGSTESQYLCSTMAKKKVIIDTDCGIDDAQAIMMALATPNVEVVGVTCVFGNGPLDNVCQNVLRVLSVCEREGVSLLKLYLKGHIQQLHMLQLFSKLPQ